MRERGILVGKLELLNPFKENNLGMALKLYLIPREDHSSFFAHKYKYFFAQPKAIPL